MVLAFDITGVALVTKCVRISVKEKKSDTIFNHLFGISILLRTYISRKTEHFSYKGERMNVHILRGLEEG